MFSNSEWSRRQQNINTEIRGLQQRRNQNGTSEEEKRGIDERIRDLERMSQEIVREMSAHACDVMVSKYRF